MDDAKTEIMQCMEVWGGNQPVNSGVIMTGIDAWVYCRPYTGAAGIAAQAGGDVYFVSSCATGRITRLLVADVSGHGSAVGDIATSLRTLMRKYVNYLDPRQFVGEMNRRFTELSEAGSFATAIVTTFFAPTNHVTFCNAGHPPPLIYRDGQGWIYAEKKERFDDSRPSNLPLGIEDSSAYHQFAVKLRVGDLVLCYTDGLPESRNCNGEFLGQEGLLEVLNSISVADPSQIVPELLRAIETLHPGNLTGDDVTVLLFRANGLGSKVPFVNRVLAPLRLLRGLAASLLPGGGPAPWPDRHPANVGGAIFDSLNDRWSGGDDEAPK
ncbi:MAG TPA: PP2C family protein-serine/threonine phosphatase [Tepidisphaeraceae bacterium]|nr:PP2C family protein-serine/threonine phosphatase [Tepidisphaeraceae bacterium]